MKEETFIRFNEPGSIDVETEILIVGAGACGLTAALKANSLNKDILIVERDSFPAGSTSMSSGFIPACNTRSQKKIGIQDSSEIFFHDILKKSKQKANAKLARLAVSTIGPTIDWLTDTTGIEWVILEDFLYPGHSRHRMHAVPERTGLGLHGRLMNAVKQCQVPIVSGALAKGLFVNLDKKISAVQIERSDKKLETIKCKSLILACNGFGGNKKLVSKYIPNISNGTYYGHPGNMGHSILWGEKIGAHLQDLSGYQGHGSLAIPSSILISWAIMTEGGIQVNLKGKRFSNESLGYSEQAEKVLSQPGGIAWNIFDQRRHNLALKIFPDYLSAYHTGIIKVARSIQELAEISKIPVNNLISTFTKLRSLSETERDEFGRDFRTLFPLIPPYYAVKVTGALFHTQGGLMINELGQVLNKKGEPFSNFFAGGGAACGVSGSDPAGYLSGNGLLTAISFGYLAGANA